VGKRASRSYSDDREGVDDVSLTERDRSYFVKVGYTWLF
jgi:hypothetical protein